MLHAGSEAIHLEGLNPQDAILRVAAEPGSFGTAFERA